MKQLSMLAAVAFLVAGCASPNINPPKARANTGYVDFHAGSSADLSWDVERFDERKQAFRRVFWEFDPPPGGVLRLAFAPGRPRLRVTFLNRVTTKPAEIVAEVQDGNITPVRVTLTDVGTALVQTKDVSAGGTGHGAYGRRAKYGDDATARYAISLVADTPVPYQPKERMSYAP
jgi:hypothetical protein